MRTLYCEGKGVARDDTKAVEWLTRAAEQGNPDARYVLALVYFDGEGARWNDGKVIEWFNHQAEQGNQQAINWLTLAAERGNYLAIEWLHQAVDKGIPTHSVLSTVKSRCPRVTTQLKH